MLLFPPPRILSHMHFFHTSSSTFVIMFTIPFTLASFSQVRFTNSINPNLLHICLHCAHHLDLHPISAKHALPISGHQILFKHHSQHPFHHCLCFSLFKSTPSCFCSNQLISNISHIPKPSTHFILPYFQIITFMPGTMLVLHIHTSQ